MCQEMLGHQTQHKTNKQTNHLTASLKDIQSKPAPERQNQSGF